MNCDQDKLDDCTNNLKELNLVMLLHTLYSVVSVMALSSCTVLCFRHYITVDKSNWSGNCLNLWDNMPLKHMYTLSRCSNVKHLAQHFVGFANSREADSKNIKH